MPRKPGLNSEFVMFDVVYEDGTQRSNRKVPRALTGGIDGDKPAHGFLIEQDREIAEKSGTAAGRRSRTSRARTRRRKTATCRGSRAGFQYPTRAKCRRNSATLRRLARKNTSKASPANGTAPTVPSSTTLAAMRANRSRGTPSRDASYSK